MGDVHDNHFVILHTK